MLINECIMSEYYKGLPVTLKYFINSVDDPVALIYIKKDIKNNCNYIYRLKCNHSFKLRLGICMCENHDTYTRSFINEKNIIDELRAIIGTKDINYKCLLV